MNMEEFFIRMKNSYLEKENDIPEKNNLNILKSKINDSYVRLDFNIDKIFQLSVFKCSYKICSKIFYNKEEFDEHVLSHKVYKCDSCSKSYREKKSLNVHVKTTHIKSKEFKCRYCDKVYNQSFCNYK
jgi:hypothetical protein